MKERYTLAIEKANEILSEAAVDEQFKSYFEAAAKMILLIDEIKTKKFAKVMSNLRVDKALVVLADNDKNVVTFDLNYASDVVIRAKTMLEAQAKFACMTALSPHVYIHKIEKTELLT